MYQFFNTKEEFITAFSEKYEEIEGKKNGEPYDLDASYATLLRLMREKINTSWEEEHGKKGKWADRTIYYFSMEFLIGKLLKYYLVNLKIEDLVKEGLKELGVDYEELLLRESDPGTGNGGLGRLAACFLDSMAHLGITGHGNGMRYRYGLFEQRIVNGYQMELPDNWLKNGYPWERCKREKAVVVKFRGNVSYSNQNGEERFGLENYEPVLAVPYDIPIIGNEESLKTNNLRLWSAEPMEVSLDMASFNAGDFAKANQYKSEVEAISYILYPDDRGPSGRELRLKQEYLIVSAGIQSILDYHKSRGVNLKELHRKVAIHINDTHPTLCIPELMRLLMDEEGMKWDEAWKITRQTISYTNHTILPEALEKWPVGLIQSLLPRIYQIIEEIDRRYRTSLTQRFGDDSERLLASTAVIRDGYVHMADLAIIGSYSVNGVAALHTRILTENVFPDFQKVFPGKFNNKTNGVSHRRFLLSANRSLSALITESIGEGWKQNAEELKKLLAFEKDPVFLDRLMAAKAENKRNLGAYIEKKYGISPDPESIFDIQVKRIHAYKRQLLASLKIMDLYNRIKENPAMEIPGFTFLFAGKAAPGYYYAKATIKLINNIAEKINSDPDMKDRIKVVFLENFNVSLGEMIYPAADISEQISTASQEASGTGNMKFMFNGAVTLGTLDGANVEILENVGPENIEIFGLKAEEVIAFQTKGGYSSREEYEKNPRLKKVLDQLRDGSWGPDTGELAMIYESLIDHNDSFFVVKDFQSYVDAFDKLWREYKDPRAWAVRSLRNIANAGHFTSDRTIREYAGEIWMKEGR